MRLFKKTNISFLVIRKSMYFTSAAVIGVGLVSLLVKGVEFGIDFKGGTEIVVAFDRPVEIGEIRTALGTVGLEKSEIKSYGAETNVLIRTGEQGEGTVVGDRIQEGLRSTIADRSFEVLKQYKVSPKIGKELRRDAAYAIFWSLLAILGYIAIRFKFIYGVGAVMALFHDVLVTLGVISVLHGVLPGINLEITLEVIAAFLTLVGVSVNDTVVIFDRIRENEKIYRSLSLGEIMNKSLNETLSRTIITSGTIFLVLAILFIFGGEVNRGFSFTMLVGVITGTYSSIYIASAVVLDASLRAKKPA